MSEKWWNGASFSWSKLPIKTLEQDKKYVQRWQ